MRLDPPRSTRRIGLAALAVTMLLAWSAESTSLATEPCIQDRWNARRARTLPWHGNYYHTAYGVPLALVVPPTATTQTKWGWGVAQTEIRSIPHQFRRPYPGDGIGGGSFLGTPPWPSHTDQFGVYYIRGPW